MINLLIGRLLPLGFLRDKLGVPSQKKSLNKMKSLGFKPSVILDLGAYTGEWSVFIKSIFPEARVLMVEGQQLKEPQLARVVENLDGSSYRIALLGAEKKEVQFNIYETASSVLTEDNVTNALVETRELQVLDELVADTPFQNADLIKIDCQGYELEILKGGTRTLRQASAVLVEVSLLKIYNECPVVADVVIFMKENGFALYDICSLMKRPFDNALYQSDFLFVKEDLFLRSSSRWK